MKSIYLFLLLFFCSTLVTFNSFSGGSSGGVVAPPPGMPPCAVNPDPGPTTCTATPICNVHGFCGTTDGSYTADYWSNLNSAFCGSIENNAFLTFTAESSTISFDAYVYNCSGGEAIQVFIFSAANCGSGPVTSHVCVNEMYAQNTPYDVTATGLTPGNQYYIMIDGYAGDVCDYTFVATDGIALPLSLSTGSEVTICTGESVVTTAIGGDGVYTWTASPDITPIDAATVKITPPTTPGDYVYVVESSGGGVPGCPSTNTYTLTIHVEPCCYIENAITSTTCDVDNNRYSVNGEIQVSSPPATGNLVVRDCNGVEQIVASAPFNLGSYSYSIANLNLGTPSCTIEAYFTSTTNCSHVLTHQAPPTSTPTFDPISVCQEDTAPTLPTTSTNGIQGTWSPAVVNTNTAGTTNYTFTPANGYCSPVTPHPVVVHPKPNAVISPNPVVFLCSIETDVDLGGSSTTPNATFQWTDQYGGQFGIIANSNTATPTVNLMGNYVMTVTDPATGCVNTANVDVIGDGNEPHASINPPGLLNCLNNTTTLVTNVTSVASPNGPFVYEWSTSDGVINSSNTLADVEVSGIGVYTVIVTDPSTGCSDGALIEVLGDLEEPQVSVLPNDPISCDDPTIFLGVSPYDANFTYNWTTTDGNILAQLDTLNRYYAAVDLAGNYTITVTSNINHCSTVINVPVTGNTILPDVNAGPDLIICENGTVTLQGSSSTPGVTYNWDATDGNIWMYGFSDIANPEVPTSAWFYLTVTDPTNNCSAIDSMFVARNVPPTLFGDTSICGNNFQVPAGGAQVNGTFEWSVVGNTGTFDDITSLTPTFTPNDPSVVNYTLVVTDSICSESDSVNITIIPNPVANSISGLCDDPKVLVSNSYSGGSWTGNGVTFTPSANTTGGLTNEQVSATASPGSYTVTFTNTECNYSQSFTLVFPVDVALFADTVVCATSFQIPNTVIGTGAGVWTSTPTGTFSDPNSLNPTFTPLGNNYQYTLTYNDACDTASVVVIFPPQPQVSTPPAYSCNDMSEILTSISYGPGFWTVNDNPSTPWLEDTAITFIPDNLTNGNMTLDSTLVMSLPTSGTYNLTFTDPTCGYSTTVTLNFIEYPWTEVNDTSVCTGTSITLTAWQGPIVQDYVWSTGAIGPETTANQAGLYYVTVSNECYSLTDSAIVSYKVCDIDAPNVISLSSKDGNNVWYVNSNGVTEYKCIILNRWGNLIYEYTDVNAVWDGRDMQGNIVSEGVYYYSLEATYENGEVVTKHGFIHVVH